MREFRAEVLNTDAAQASSRRAVSNLRQGLGLPSNRSAPALAGFQTDRQLRRCVGEGEGGVGRVVSRGQSSRGERRVSS